MRATWPVLALLAVATSFPASAVAPEEELYTCRDASGAVVFQNDPCDVAPKNKKKTPPPAAAKSAKPAKVAKGVKPMPEPPAKVQPAAIPASLPSPAPRHGSTYLSKPIRPVIDPSVFTSDPRWGSPERTLKTFVGAMKGGDQALARACLAQGATDDLDRMRATVDAFNGYVLEGEVGPYWSIRALRPRMRPKWIFFTRAGDGTWRIAAL